MPTSIGRPKKQKRRNKTKPKNNVEVTPDVSASSPAEKESSPFAKLLTEIKFASKVVRIQRVRDSIISLLDKVCDAEEEARECVESVLSEFTERQCTGRTDVDVSHDTPMKIPPVRPPVSTEIEYNPRAFLVDGRNVQAARQMKKRKIDSIAKAINNIETPQQQLLCLHTYVQRNLSNNAAISTLFKTTNSCGIDIINNLKKTLSHALANQNTLDSKTFIQTVLMSIAPGEMPSPKLIRKLTTSAIGVSKNCKTIRRNVKLAVAKRKSILSNADADKRVKFVQHFKFKKRTIFTAHFIQRLHDWLLQKCDSVVASPCQNKSILVKDLFTGENKRTQKYHYVSSVQDLHNELIDPVHGFPEARDAEGTVIISDTTLRNLLPKQLSRLTDSQKQMCGCEICVVSKEFVQTLLGWCKRIVKEWRDKGKSNEAREMEQFLVNKKIQHPRDIVAKGVYWNEVGRAKRWYTPPSRKVQRVFRVRYVVDANMKMEPEETEFPKNRRDRNKIIQLGPRKVAESTHQSVMDELARRARLDYEEGMHVDGVGDDGAIETNGADDDDDNDSSSEEED